MSTSTPPADVATMTAEQISAELRALAEEERAIEGRIDALAATGDEDGIMRLLSRQRVVPARIRALRLGDLDRQIREMEEEARADRQRAEERRPLIEAAQARLQQCHAELRDAEEAHQRLIGESNLDRLGQENRVRRRRDLDAERGRIASPVPSNVTPIGRGGFGPSRFADPHGPLPA